MTFDISEINFIVYNELVKWMRHMNKLFNYSKLELIYF